MPGTVAGLSGACKAEVGPRPGGRGPRFVSSTSVLAVATRARVGEFPVCGTLTVPRQRLASARDWACLRAISYSRRLR